MKKSILIGDILDLNLKEYELDGFIIASPVFSKYAIKYFKDSEIDEILAYCKEHNKLSILKIDRIIKEEELDDLENYINSCLKKGFDYYMFTDISILEIFKEHNLLNRLIYSSSTLLTSYNDCKFYEEMGVLVMPSTELDFDSIKKISSLDNVCINCFGYLDIFYSKRNLITLYESFIKERNIKKSRHHNKVLKIVEESRDEDNMILENDRGTFIFSNFIYCLYKELNVFAPKMYYINTYRLPCNIAKNVTNIYKKAIDTKPLAEDYSRLLEYANEINATLSSGFLYKQSNILKGDDDE